MPVTFWTFLIGGFALSGFPLVTAGFWSKDEILADAFGHGHWVVFSVLAISALLTAFYTMRQITLTFLGEPRTEEAKYAQETPWTMLLPLVVLAFFAVTFGWVGIPEDFMGLRFPTNWFHEFVGGTLLEHPEKLTFNWVPLLTSLIVALGGLALGWMVYIKVKAGAEDPLSKPLGRVYVWMKNKWYHDEVYEVLFVRPAYWVAEQFTYLFLDRKVIDGFLHLFARLAPWIGKQLREVIDLPIINGLIGDGSASVTQYLGRKLKFIQTGKVQQYMLAALIFSFATLAYFLVTLRP